MKIRKATLADHDTLLALMHESFQRETEPTADEWAKTKTAIGVLLNDPQAGEAYLTCDSSGAPAGYIIMCRGFSLDYGGYFTWVEESYMRQAGKSRFRDQRFSP